MKKKGTAVAMASDKKIARMAVTGRKIKVIQTTTEVPTAVLQQWTTRSNVKLQAKAAKQLAETVNTWPR